MARLKLSSQERADHRRKTIKQYRARQKLRREAKGIRIYGPRGERVVSYEYGLSARKLESACKKRFRCSGILTMLSEGDEVLLTESTKIEPGTYAYFTPKGDGPGAVCDRCFRLNLRCHTSILMPEVCFLCVINRIRCARDGSPEERHEYRLPPAPRIVNDKLILEDVGGEAAPPPPESVGPIPEPLGRILGAIAVRRGELQRQLRLWVDGNRVCLAAKVDPYLVLTFLERRQPVAVPDDALCAKYPQLQSVKARLKTLVHDLPLDQWIVGRVATDPAVMAPPPAQDDQ